REGRGRLLGVPLRPNARRTLELPPLGLGVEPVQLDRLRLGLDEGVHADDHALAGLDLRLVAVRRILALPLDETLLDRRDGPACLVHTLDQLPRALLELVRQRLEEVRAP